MEQVFRHFVERSRHQLAVNLWREAPLISPIPISASPLPPLVRVTYLTLVDAGLLTGQPKETWFIPALQRAQKLPFAGTVSISGTGKKLRARGQALNPISKTPLPVVLTALVSDDQIITPISVDLMTNADASGQSFQMTFDTAPIGRQMRDVVTERLIFFALDPVRKEAYPLEIMPVPPPSSPE